MTVGLAGLLAIRILSKLFCLKCCSVILSEYGLMGLWMTVIAPLLFNFIFKEGKIEKHLLSRVEFIFIRKVILIILLMLQLFYSIFIKYFK